MFTRVCVQKICRWLQSWNGGDEEDDDDDDDNNINDGNEDNDINIHTLVLIVPPRN